MAFIFYRYRWSPTALGTSACTLHCMSILVGITWTDAPTCGRPRGEIMSPCHICERGIWYYWWAQVGCAHLRCSSTSPDSQVSTTGSRCTAQAPSHMLCSSSSIHFISSLTAFCITPVTLLLLLLDLGQRCSAIPARTPSRYRSTFQPVLGLHFFVVIEGVINNTCKIFSCILVTVGLRS